MTTGLPDDNSEPEPPDPISNSAVKRFSADGSVGFPHVRVGHRQAHIQKPSRKAGLFSFRRQRAVPVPRRRAVYDSPNVRTDDVSGSLSARGPLPACAIEELPF